MDKVPLLKTTIMMTKVVKVREKMRRKRRSLKCWDDS